MYVGPEQHEQLRCVLYSVMLIVCTDTRSLHSSCSPVALCEDKANWSKQEFLIRAIESGRLFVAALHEIFYGTSSVQSETAGPQMHPAAQSVQNSLQRDANVYN